jgi:hypothetical protein
LLSAGVQQQSVWHLPFAHEPASKDIFADPPPICFEGSLRPDFGDAEIVIQLQRSPKSATHATHDPGCSGGRPNNASWSHTYVLESFSKLPGDRAKIG